MLDIIDRARYFVVPKTTGRRLLTLGRLLTKYAPETQSVDVAETQAMLEAEIATVSQAFIDRHREYGPSIAAEDSELDVVVDILLGIFCERLDQWQVFERPAVERLAAKQKPDGFDFAGHIEKAKIAKRARKLLFAAGLEYTWLPYADQAEHMRVLQTLIAQEKLEEALDLLVGPSFMAALRECHVEYLEMVENRAVRERGSSINLRTLGANLQRAIQNYLIALLAMLRDDNPKNVAQIRRALRPVDALREQLYRERSRGAASGEFVDEQDAEVIDELVAEQQVVDEEIGLPPDFAAELPAEPPAADAEAITP